MELYINYENNSQHETVHHSDEAYDFSWSEDNDYKFINVNSKRDGELIVYNGEPKKGDILYYVWVSYSSGDSFGSSSNVLESIGLYDSMEKALTVKKFIEEDDKNNPEPDYDSSKQYIDPDGLPVYLNTWKGYFEQLSSVNIEELEYIG